MTNTSPEPQTDSFSRQEEKWLKGNRKSLAKIARELTDAKKGEPISAQQLETIYDTWFDEWSQSNQERGAMDADAANAMCMLIGVGLRDVFIERIPELEWKVITDPFGTDVGLHAKKVGTVVTHPTNMVAKRIQSGETTWIAKTVDAIAEDLRSLLDTGSPSTAQ